MRLFLFRALQSLGIAGAFVVAGLLLRPVVVHASLSVVIFGVAVPLSFWLGIIVGSEQRS